MSTNNLVGKKRLLVIDDDPVVVKLVSSRLSMEGFEVMAFQDAPAALEQAIKEKPDLIILDVMMPIVNGYNFCRLLKSEEDHKDIPILFLTSRANEKDREIGNEVGANAYLTKPIDMDKLLKTIKELLNLS